MAWGQAAAQPDSLYKRLGGYDALAAVTDDFIGRLATDPALSKFFEDTAQTLCIESAS